MAPLEISFTVPIEPQGKARPRRRSGQVRVYTPRKTRKAEDAVRYAFAQVVGGRWKPWEGPVAVTVTAFFKRPKAWPKKRHALAKERWLPCLKLPDADNILKLVCDALNPSEHVWARGAWKDDKQVVDARVLKAWTNESGGRIAVHLQFLAADAPLGVWL